METAIKNIGVAKVAMIPFTNMSANADQEYFSDGVSEDIIDALTNVDGLMFISRGSSFDLKEQKLSIEEIGEKLHVDYALTGTLRRIGSKVRMRVYLHATEDGSELWSKSFDQKIDEIFDIQGEIIDAVCSHLLNENQLSKIEQPLFRPVTRNLKAYDQYLQGLFFHNKWTMGDLSKAINHYERAIKREPSHYQAYAMMANAYTRLSFAGGYSYPVKSYTEARDAANRAIEINPNYYRSYTALSYVFLYHNYDWEQALMMANKALKLNPKSTKTMVAKALYYTLKGNFTESRKWLNQALELDPWSFMAQRAQADNYFLEGKYKTAMDLYNKLLERDPFHEKILEYKGWCVVMLGELDNAIEMFKRIDTKTAMALKSYCQIGYAHAIKGDIEKAENYLKEIERSAVINKGLTYALDFAVIYTAMGEYEKAMEQLEIAVENKRSAIVFLKVNPIWDPLRNHPGFKGLLKRLRLN